MEVATGRYVQVQLHPEGSSPFRAGARMFSRRACTPELCATVLALEVVNVDFKHTPSYPIYPHRRTSICTLVSVCLGRFPTGRIQGRTDIVCPDNQVDVQVGEDCRGTSVSYCLRLDEDMALSASLLAHVGEQGLGLPLLPE
eukprot:12900910-Heterocapsa_arctica.AAC.1